MEVKIAGLPGKGPGFFIQPLLLREAAKAWINRAGSR
jgi:hypothetical protein